VRNDFVQWTISIGKTAFPEAVKSVSTRVGELGVIPTWEPQVILHQSAGLEGNPGSEDAGRL
jgi:hypothetical protein